MERVVAALVEGARSKRGASPKATAMGADQTPPPRRNAKIDWL